MLRFTVFRITSVCSAELDELSTIKLRLAAHVACSAMILNFDLDFALLVIKKARTVKRFMYPKDLRLSYNSEFFCSNGFRRKFGLTATFLVGLPGCSV